jgi:hypothetical protein
VGDQQEGGQGVQAARALADVVAEAGPGAWADAGRLEALLQARLGEGSGSALAQVKVLARAAARGVPAGLRSKTPAAGLVQQLVEWEGLDPAVAEWSVRTWEWALGVLPSSSEVAAAPAPAPAAPVTDLAATTAVGRALPPPGTGRVASIPPPAGSRSAPAPERGRNGGLVVLLAAGVAALVLAAVALGVVLLRDDPVTTEVITAAEQPATTSSTTTSTTSTSTSTTTTPTSTTTQPTQPPTTQPTQPPTTQPPPPPPPPPSTSGGLDGSDVRSDVSHPEAPRLLATFETYSDGINTADYRSAWSLLSLDAQARTPFDEFVTGTTSSVLHDMRIRSVVGPTDGRLSANVTFTSTQLPEHGPDGQACSLWDIEYSMVEVGGQWRIDRADAQNGTPVPC